MSKWKNVRVHWLTHREGRGLELRTSVRRLAILLVSWAKRLRKSSSCLSCSGVMLSDAMTAEQLQTRNNKEELDSG